jgi:hypothetical protein
VIGGPLRKLHSVWTSFWQPVRRLIAVSGYLWSVRNDPELLQVSRSYMHWLPLNLFSEPAQWLRLVIGSRHRYRTAMQRPYDIYVPHLKAMPFHSALATCQSLESRWREIHAEYLGLADPDGPPLNQEHVRAGRWGNFNLVARRRRVDENARHCPITMQTVDELPLLGWVIFSSLAPGTELRPHFGPTNIGLRHQLCLENAPGAQIRVGGVWRSWEEGKCLVIDDSFEHEVAHRGDQRRVVLLVDCWHPELSPKEREFLKVLYPQL